MAKKKKNLVGVADVLVVKPPQVKTLKLVNRPSRSVFENMITQKNSAHPMNSFASKLKPYVIEHYSYEKALAVTKDARRAFLGAEISIVNARIIFDFLLIYTEKEKIFEQVFEQV